MAFDGLLKRAVFGRRGLGDQPAAPASGPIAAELQRLDLYKKGLGAEAIRYVTSGDNSGVLDTIDACATATPIFAAPYHKEYQAKADTLGATNLGLVRGTIEPGRQVGRMMAVRCAVKVFQAPYTATPQPIPQIPAGKMPLFALFTALDAGIDAAKVSYTVPWDTLIPLRGVLDLVTATGGTIADLFGFILRRDGTRFLGEGSWHADAAFGALVRAHPDVFAEAMLTTAIIDRSGTIALIEHHGLQALPPVMKALTGMLTRPFEKNDRERAISALARLEGDTLRALLERELASADIDMRFGLVQAAARNGAPALIALLGERNKVEKAAKVKAAIEAVLDACQPSPDACAEAGYTAIDGSFVAIPPAIALGDPEAPIPSDPECDAFMACIDAIHAARDEMRKQNARADLMPFTREEIEATFSLMTEGEPPPAGVKHALATAVRGSAAGRAWYDAILDRLPPGIALRSMLGQWAGEFNHLVSGGYIDPHYRWTFDKLRGWIETGAVDLRALAAVESAMLAAHHAATGQPAQPYDPLSRLRQTLPTSQPFGQQPYRSPLAALPAIAVWPWLAENMALLDEAFGLKPASKPIWLDAALGLLELLPAVPQRYLGKLIEIAVTGKRPVRRRAMALVRGASDLDARISALLDDARQPVRIHAATWLADIRADGAEAVLRKRLKKEKSDPVRTALIEALQRIGADLSDIIGRASLIADAEAAAAKGPIELPGWLTAAGLPVIRFRDGPTVPEPVLRHWLALAIRLKDPGATGQFGIYLDQLDPADARALSGWLLESWIEYDTRMASLDDANAHAIANYAQDFRWRYKPQTAELRDEIIADLRRQKLGEMLNSGTDTKGMLALACRAEPVWAANRVRGFLKKHGRRSHQAMALLDMLAGIGAPAALQVVIAASARLRQKSTQAHAAEIAERYAEDRGWSYDELADRTVPAAGFDDDGVLELPCGEDAKPYSARLDAMLTIQILNPEGKPVKALPAGDDETTRESQKALSGAKKELKQVVDLQAARLFEAMCVERSWPVADWRTAFHEHPVMRRLVERLVWQGLDAEARPLGLFRPTQEGDFTDATDAPVDLEGFARVRLAHGALVDAETCRSWAAHLKDYEIAPFLDQFDALRAPLSEAESEAEAITDRTGWVAPSLTWRGVAEKRGYERVMRDGGGCNEYVKVFPSHGITATIFHTGSYAVDENNRVALKQLRFDKEGHRGPFRLKDVPPVMLAECWADYHAIAARGAFEPDWETVSPW